MIRALVWTCWNTFLAAIPVGLGHAVSWLARQPATQPRLLRQALLVVLSLVWFAFLPNTCYLLTEWRHFLDRVQSSALWEQWRGGADRDAMAKLMAYTLFYLCYSGIGMVAFTLAIRPMRRLAEKRAAVLWPWEALFFALVSFGVYLGLVLRFNSWDLVGRAGDVWSAAISLASRPLLAALILLFGGFLWVGYVTVDIWVDGFLLRWKQSTAPPAR